MVYNDDIVIQFSSTGGFPLPSLLLIVAWGGTILAAATSPDDPLKNRLILAESRGSSASYWYGRPTNPCMRSILKIHPHGLVVKCLLIKMAAFFGAAASPEELLKNRMIVPESQGRSASFIYEWSADQGMGSNPIFHPAGFASESEFHGERFGVRWKVEGQSFGLRSTCKQDTADRERKGQ